MIWKYKLLLFTVRLLRDIWMFFGRQAESVSRVHLCFNRPSSLTLSRYSCPGPGCRTGAGRSHRSSPRIKDFCPTFRRRSAVLWAREQRGRLAARVRQLTNGTIFSTRSTRFLGGIYDLYGKYVFTPNTVADLVSHARLRQQHLWCSKETSPKRERVPVSSGGV